jgi:hypothetical protein
VLIARDELAAYLLFNVGLAAGGGLWKDPSQLNKEKKNANGE